MTAARLAVTVLALLISSVLAVHFYKRSRLKSVVLLAVQEVGLRTLLDGFEEAAKLTMGGDQVPDLCRMQFVLRNTGVLAVAKADVVKPLVLRLKQGEFLRARASDPRPADLWFHPTVEGAGRSELLLEFDLLNPGDQATLTILCRGASLSDIEIHGHIAGLRQVIAIDMALRHWGIDDRRGFLRRRIQQMGLLIWWGGLLILWAIGGLFSGGHRITLEHGFGTTTWQELVGGGFLIMVGCVPVFFGLKYLVRYRDALGFFSGWELLKLLIAPRTVARRLRQVLNLQ